MNTIHPDNTPPQNFFGVPSTSALADNQIYFLPPGSKAILRRPERRPAFHSQLTVVEDASAFEQYLERQVREPARLAIYVNTRDRKVTAFLDHATEAGKPGSNVHVCKLELPLSAEFEPLHKIIKQGYVSQAAFVDFVEMNGHLFVEAAPLQQFAANFSSITITRIVSKRDPQTDRVTLIYAEEGEKEDEHTVKALSEVTAVLPIFATQPDCTLKLLLRTKITNKKEVQFALVCPGLEKTITDEVIKVESRLQLWLTGLGEKQRLTSDCPDWTKAMMLRGQPTVTTPTPEQFEAIANALPAYFGLNDK